MIQIAGITSPELTIIFFIPNLYHTKSCVHPILPYGGNQFQVHKLKYLINIRLFSLLLLTWSSGWSCGLETGGLRFLCLLEPVCMLKMDFMS